MAIHDCLARNTYILRPGTICLSAAAHVQLIPAQPSTSTVSALLPNIRAPTPRPGLVLLHRLRMALHQPQAPRLQVNNIRHLVDQAPLLRLPAQQLPGPDGPAPRVRADHVMHELGQLLGLVRVHGLQIRRGQEALLVGVERDGGRDAAPHELSVFGEVVAFGSPGGGGTVLAGGCGLAEEEVQGGEVVDVDLGPDVLAGADLEALLVLEVDAGEVVGLDAAGVVGAAAGTVDGGGQTMAVLVVAELVVPAARTTVSTCRWRAPSGMEVTVAMLSQSSKMKAVCWPKVWFSKSENVRMPVPEVWIQYPGEVEGWAARPLAMAWADGRWSQFANSRRGWVLVMVIRGSGDCWMDVTYDRQCRRFWPLPQSVPQRQGHRRRGGLWGTGLRLWRLYPGCGRGR